MAVTAASDALTTVEVVRAWLGISVDDEGEFDGDAGAREKDRLQLLINSFSRAIHRFTGRQFKPAEDSASKRFRYDGSGYLSLEPYEARTVSAVVLYTDLPSASQRTLTAQSATSEGEYRLEPRNKTPEQTYLWLALPEIGQFSPVAGEDLPTRRARGHEVTVTGTWGADTVPADVEMACLVAVATAFRNPERFASREMGGLGFTEQQDPPERIEQSIPRAARALLGPYRRVRVG